MGKFRAPAPVQAPGKTRLRAPGPVPGTCPLGLIPRSSPVVQRSMFVVQRCPTFVVQRCPKTRCPTFDVCTAHIESITQDCNRLRLRLFPIYERLLRLYLYFCTWDYDYASDYLFFKF